MTEIFADEGNVPLNSHTSRPTSRERRTWRGKYGLSSSSYDSSLGFGGVFASVVEVSIVVLVLDARIVRSGWEPQGNSIGTDPRDRKLVGSWRGKRL